MLPDTGETGAEQEPESTGEIWETDGRKPEPLKPLRIRRRLRTRAGRFRPGCSTAKVEQSSLVGKEQQTEAEKVRRNLQASETGG